MANQNEDKRRTVIWFDIDEGWIEYPSQSALARAKGVSRQRVSQWLAAGYDGDDKIQRVGRPPTNQEAAE